VCGLFGLVNARFPPFRGASVSVHGLFPLLRKANKIMWDTKWNNLPPTFASSFRRILLFNAIGIAFNLGLNSHPGYLLNRFGDDFSHLLMDCPALTDKRRLLLMFIKSLSINCLSVYLLKSNNINTIGAIINFILRFWA